MLRPAALDPAALPVPLLGRLLPAGFPSPADDYLDSEIDLGAFLIERPTSTFLMRVAGESMKEGVASVVTQTARGTNEGGNTAQAANLPRP